MLSFWHPSQAASDSGIHDFGNSQIGLEIVSDHQEKIDRSMKTGNGLSNIEVHSQIDCREYRNLFNLIGGQGPDKRPTPIALDLPKSKYGENISRDEWMAESIAIVLESNPNAKILVVVGNIGRFVSIYPRTAGCCGRLQSAR
jgi:hypothetical protein